MAKKSPDTNGAPKAAPAQTAPAPEPATGSSDSSLTKAQKAQAARLVGIAAKRVFAFRDHGDHVGVTTIDGQKLKGLKR